MSILGRMFRRLLKPRYFVGRDLEGNKYFEYPNANDGHRPKRMVQYKRTDDMWTYIASRRRLPVQWTAWLTHTRPNPPTTEELQADLVRQQRVQMNVKMLEARDREERERMAGLANSQEPEPRLENPTKTEPSKSPVDMRSESSAPVHDPWAEANRGSSDEPHPWKPVVRR